MEIFDAKIRRKRKRFGEFINLGLAKMHSIGIQEQRLERN